MAFAVATLLYDNQFPSVDAQTTEAEAGVRVSAQRLEDGRVQFGLRARDATGEWAQPVEPRVNSFDPATARAGRWLSSSALILEVDESGQGRLVPSRQFEPSPQIETTLVTGVDGWTDDIRYAAYHDADDDLVTTVSVYSAASGAPDGELRTTITCQDGEHAVTLGGLSSDLGSGATAQRINVSWSVDGGPSASEQRAAWPVEGGSELISLGESSLADALLSEGSSLALSIATTPALATTIDLAALAALSVYDNLLHCGADDSTTSSHSGQTELRIRAMLRDDDRIEFAIQQRADSEWSENILPSARIIPAFGDATNWLSSSTVTVQVAVSPSGGISFPDAVQQTAAAPITPVLRSGWRTGTLEYATEHGESTALNSIVTAHGDDGLQLQMGCLGGARRVQIAGAPADATGQLSLSFDDAATAANWSVTAGDDSTTLRPADAERMIERLRRASSLAVGSPGSDTVTFDLSGMFETPIQTNIDQCGNYTEPAWRPVTEAQTGKTDAGATYNVDYPERLQGERRTSISISASGEATGSQERPISLSISCEQGRRTFQVGNLPSADGDYSVRSRVGDGAWTEDSWRIRTTPSGWTYAFPALDYEQLRNGSTVEYEIALDPVVRMSFNLAALFDSPVQTNIDNCDVDLWPQTAAYVPIVNVSGGDSASVSYHSSHRPDGSVYSQVQNTTESAGSPDGRIALTAYCSTGSSNVVMQLARIRKSGERSLTVGLTVDDRPSVTSSWWVGSSGADSSHLFSRDGLRLMAQMRGASSLTVEIVGSSLEPFTFDLSGMFDTPVQENLDECGYYEPGETREPPPPLNTSGNTQGINGDATTISWNRTQGAGPIPNTELFEMRQGVNRPEIALTISCGPSGARVVLSQSLVDALIGDSVAVQWSLDRGPTQHETWVLTPFSGVGILHPIDAIRLIASWRNGSVLEFKVSGENPIEQRFDLGTLFASPVVDSFDECVEQDQLFQAAPITVVPSVTEGSLRYGASVAVGAKSGFTWLIFATESSYVRLSCGIDGLGVQVGGISASGGASIAGDTVQVTWRVGSGAPQTETWDAWLLGQSYSISPPDDAAFFAAFNGADSLSISVASDPVFNATYNLAGNGYWTTPVQPNLDACGGS